jgi:hypothetical protein
MPAGPGPIGFLAFSGVKFLGYTAAAAVLQRAYQTTRNPWVVGLGRTGIGLVAGTIFGGVWFLVSSRIENKWPDWLAAICFFGPLIPIRLGEWCLLIHWFFDRGLRHREEAEKYAMIGSLWSFALDAVGIAAAFVVPGGFWIC